jgi:hypothetical protein
MYVDGVLQPPDGQAMRQMARDAARFQAEMAKAQAEIAREQAKAAGQQAITTQPGGPMEGVRITGKDGETIVIDANTIRQALAGTIAVPPAPPQIVRDPGPPDSVVAIIIIAILASTAVLFPIARALGRRLDRKGSATPSQAPELTGRLDRIEQAVDAIAIEVERISEGQRFTTKLLGDRVAEPLLVRQGATEVR